MKKALLLILTGVLVLSLAACTKRDDTVTTQDSPAVTDKAVSEGKGTERNRENLWNTEPVTDEDGNVMLTIPASLFDEYNPASTEIPDDLKEKGIFKAVLNKDGSLTYYEKREDFEKNKEQAKQDALKTFADYPKNNDFIRSVAASEDFSVINVKVDKEGYTTELSGVAIVWEIGLNGEIAQVMAGVQPDKLSVSVVVTDADTGEVINAARYP